MAYFWKGFLLGISFSVIILGVKSTEDCPKFVCPTVYDDIAQDEIQLEARQVPRPPIVDLQQYGINEKDMTHWSCERPKEEVRLGWNANSHGEGRVEIFYFNKWGTVCNTTWSMAAANVVCRQLGFWRAYASVNASVFGSTSGPVWLDNTECSGDEDSLYRCRKDRIGQNQCGHETDAAIVCDLTGQLIVSNTGGVKRNLLYYNTNGTAPFEKGPLNDVHAIGLYYHHERNTLYWIHKVNDNFCEMRRMVMNGSNLWETFVSVSTCDKYSSSMTVDDVSGYIFWTEPEPSARVMKRDILGTNQAVEVHRYESAYGRTIVIRKATRTLYVLRWHQIEQRSLDFTQISVIVEFPYGAERVRCLALDEPGGKVYYVLPFGPLKMVDIDGGIAQDVTPIIGGTPSGMIVASGWIMWVEAHWKRVGRIALRGGSGETIYHDIGEIADVPFALVFIPS